MLQKTLCKWNNHSLHQVDNYRDYDAYDLKSLMAVR